jgi:GTP-binding protein YchF
VRLGIVGLPNAGKSSLFNALTRAGVPAANYPFTTVDPHLAVVPVPDERLEQVAAVTGASELAPDTIEFRDIAGLVEGAHRGEGLGNRFLGHIRETDAILHVVRCHDEPDVVHPAGRVDPVPDAEVVEAELRQADLEQTQRRLDHVGRQARAGDPEARTEEAWLEEVIAALEAGRTAAEPPAPEGAPDAPRALGLLTAKPVLYVANVQEGTAEVPAALAEHATARASRAVPLSARLEAELAELPGEEAAVMRSELGAGEGGLAVVLREAFALLALVAFFTAHPGTPATSRHVPRGTTAHRAAGAVHTDMQRGFVRAEVIDWQELVDAGSIAAARERGSLRTEGRDYVVADGDVITFRFAPP